MCGLQFSTKSVSYCGDTQKCSVFAAVPSRALPCLTAAATAFGAAFFPAARGLPGLSVAKRLKAAPAALLPRPPARAAALATTWLSNGGQEPPPAAETAPIDSSAADSTDPRSPKGTASSDPCSSAALRRRFFRCCGPLATSRSPSLLQPLPVPLRRPTRSLLPSRSLLEHVGVDGTESAALHPLGRPLCARAHPGAEVGTLPPPLHLPSSYPLLHTSTCIIPYAHLARSTPAGPLSRRE